ncbi:MAG: TolC family outer membrane protein [Paracoccaceae bacterium]
MKMIWAVVVAALAFSPVATGGARAETLPDALVSAYRHSNLLEQNRALLRAADEDLATAVSALRPVINFVANASYRYAELAVPGGKIGSDGTAASIGLSGELLLFDGGSSEMGIEAAKEVVMATRQALTGLEQQVLLAALSAYLDVRSAEDVVALSHSNVRLITQELRAAQDRFEVGEITRTDVAIAEARLASSRASLAAAEGDLLVAREAYKAATGAYPGRLAPPPPPPATAKSLDEAKAVALRNHPQVIAARHEARVAELNVARARAAMGPRVGLGGAITLNDGGLNERSLSLTLTQPVYQGGRLSALYRRAIAVEAAQKSAMHQAGVEAAQAAGDAWARLAVAYAAIEAGDRQVRAAQTAYDGVREEARLGSRTTLDVLNAEQELLDARTSRIAAENQRNVAVYAVLASMGLLTVKHLGLGIPSYDPDTYFSAVKNAPATSPQGKKLDRILKSIGKN